MRLEDRLLGGRRLQQPAFNVCGRHQPDVGPKALLVYLARPFRLRKHHPSFRHHQNLRQARQIAEVLDSFGFVVDVADAGDRDFRPAHPYELLINHRVDYEGLEQAIGPHTLKVYLSSGMNHVVHNLNQKARVQYFVERKGRTPKNLIWDQEEMPFLKIADALVGFGNEHTMASWQSVFAGPRYGFDNYSLTMPTIDSRDWEAARKHFLFFGSRQQVGKGLDLLLEVFAQSPEHHLWVCSHYRDEPDFCDCYTQELFHTPNIHPCGFVDIGGRTFRAIISRCGFVIHPSCSEGSPGSVINAMATGLVPLLSRESGVEVGAGGFLLSDCRIETLAKTVQCVSLLPPAELRGRSAKVLQLSAERFSEERFIQRWRELIGTLSRQSPRPVTL